MSKKNKLFNKTIHRKPIVNIIWCVFFILGSLIVPTLIGYLFKFIIHDKYVCSLIGDIIFIILMVIVYYRDLKDEFRIFNNNIKTILKPNIKYYFIGLFLMIGFNIIISSIFGNVSMNEDKLRELLFDKTTFMLINIVLIAPLTEELVYRKSVFTVVKNKYLYAIISGLLFGIAHIMINILSGAFVMNDLLFILPYGSFGFMFAIMDYESDTVFSSVMMHSIHNLLNGLMLINMHMLGVL